MTTPDEFTPVEPDDIDRQFLDPSGVAGTVAATQPRPEDGPQPAQGDGYEESARADVDPDEDAPTGDEPYSGVVSGARAPTATAFLNVARSQIGYTEGRNNDSKYGRWYGMNHAPYCAIALTWVGAQVGATSILGGKFAYCPYWVSHWKRTGRFHSWTTTPQRGDIVFFDWSGRHRLAMHVGVVESYDAAREVVTCIEFNTSSGLTGSQSDGGGVWRRRRNKLYVVGFGRPAWGSETSVRPLPARPARSGRRPVPLVVDGGFGPMTVRRLQQALGFTGRNVDGAAGPMTWRALQRKIGITGRGVDGRPGPNTYAVLQRWLKVRVTRRLDRATVMALQRWLNRLPTLRAARIPAIVTRAVAALRGEH